MSEIRLRNIEKRFGRDVIAVNDLTMTIEDRDFVCLLGPSGCGKTTTLRMIAGLERPTAGEIWLGDRCLDSRMAGTFVPPEKRSMGLVFQNYALWPHMRVAENIAFGLKVEGTSRESVRRRVGELTDLLRIDGLEGRYPYELSGGQQQRVALARMLATSPEVLLLDEPLSNLDAKLRLEMRAELKRLHRELGTTIIFVTHDQHEAMTLATDIAVMSEGELQQFAPPMDVYSRPANEFIADFVGSPPMGFVPAASGDIARSLRDHLAANGWTGDVLADVGNFGIRPEAFKLSQRNPERDPEDWVTRATIDAVLPTGASWLVSLALPGGLGLFAMTFEEPDVAEGATVDVAVALRDIHAFDSQGQSLGRSGARAPAVDGSAAATEQHAS